MSEIRVDSIKNTAGTGSPTFTGNISAGGFVRTGGGSGFLKADGSEDNNSYLTTAAIGNGTVNFATAGTGLNLSASPSFTMNQSGNKNITISLNSTNAATANTLVSRDGSGNSSFATLSATTVSATSVSATNVSSSSVMSTSGGIYAWNTSMVNNPLTLTGIFPSPGLVTDISATFATGINIAIASPNVNAATVEFYKTRRSGTLTGTRASAAARDAIMGLISSADDGTSDTVVAQIYASVTPTEDLSDSTNKAAFFQFVYNADDAFGSNIPLREWVTFGEALNSTDSVGPTTIRIPFVTQTAGGNAARFDANNRLIKANSTRALKEGVEDLDRSYAYNMLNNLKPVWYRSKCAADNPDWSWYGMIAEDVSEVDPRMATWEYADDQYELTKNDEGVVHKTLKSGAQLSPQSVAYDRLSVVLWKVVQDQQTAIANLEAKVRTLESA